ncbi:MAG: septum formation protein Maf [Clostridia bacterium]|nr:septum formation protein Maf [Deltaproteobacteria bacterium]
MGVQTRRLILASGSPRRRELLTAAGYDVVVDSVSVDESWPEGSVESGIVVIVKRKLGHLASYADMTVAADTTVVLGHDRFGKPADDAEARSMLHALSGREHNVLTGFVVRYGDKERSDVIVTRVAFRPLTDLEIDLYIDSGECFDKAGAYGIQGKGGVLIDHISGSFTNVIGLPLAQVKRTIDELCK